jgi:hypothetical protein
MSYIVNQSRVHSLTINGVDYTNALIEWTASDSSANKQGLITTQGQLVLGFYSGGPEVADYDRDDFKRGYQVILTMTKPDGTTYRHPRGLLYVIATSYDIESYQLIITLGCQISLAKLTDDKTNLLALSPIPLESTQEEISNVDAAFAQAGKYLYQDNTGSLVSGLFFNGDNLEGVAAGEWTSVLGVTALSANMLAGSSPVPDRIKLTYQVPASVVSTDQQGRVDTVTTASYYFLDYPASIFVRSNTDSSAANPNGTIGNNTSLDQDTQAPGNTANPCGNAQDNSGDESGACSDGYELEQVPILQGAIRNEIQQTYYNGPAAQQSYSTGEIYGPVLEANQSYFSDRYAYCAARFNTACNRNNCQLEGMTQTLLSKRNSKNVFGSCGEVVRTIDESYSNSLSIAQAEDWRSGTNEKGYPEDFRYLPEYMFRDTVVIRDSYKDGNVNVEDIKTYTSISVRNPPGAIYKGANFLDAYNGILTRSIRRSSSTATIDLAPDIANSPSTDTVEKETEIPMFTGRYVTPPTEAGPYEIEDTMPLPLLYDTQTEIDNVLTAYTSYLERFTKGDAFGLQISEALREDVGQNWYPGMPFRFYDPKEGKVLAMRMDATQWGVNLQESAFVTNGIWIGVSDGSVTVPDNVLGNSKVDISVAGTDPTSTDPVGGNTAPPNAPGTVIYPSVTGETSVDNGSFAFVIKVNLTAQHNVFIYGNTGVKPVWDEDGEAPVKTTFVVYCQGLSVTTGSLLSPDSNGSIPLEYLGTLVTAGGTVVDPDLFDPLVP